MKFNIWKILLVGVIFAVLAEILHTLSAFIEMPYYTMQQYFPVWSKIMMPAAGPPPMSFYVYAVAFAFVTGLLFAFFYNVVMNSIPGKKLCCKGAWYGFLIFLVAAVPSYLSLYLLINLPKALIAIWAGIDLIIYLVAGMICAWLIKGK